MKVQLACAVLALGPALALLASYPRRLWAAAAGAAFCAVAGAGLIVWAGAADRSLACVCAGWGVLGSLYGLLLCRRSLGARAVQADDLARARQRREEIAR